jgi:KipI family sensor histidine kinase inhibitor
VNVSIERLGESALVSTVTGITPLEAAPLLWRLARDARTWDGVVDAVAGAGNLSLILDPDTADFTRLEERIRASWSAPSSPAAPGRTIEIPVAYGGEAGADLAIVAAHAGLSELRTIERHAAGEYVVLFVGFLPGFAYLGGLDTRLAVPRRSEPRAAVAAGTVAIGGDLSGIYPFRSPGGWHAIGRTDATMFDSRRSPAALLAPGDRVVFVPVR